MFLLMFSIFERLTMRKGTGRVGRETRKQQILDTVWTLNRYVTVSELAYHLHLEPSTFLRNIVKELVAEKYLQTVQVAHRGWVEAKTLYALKSENPPVQERLL
jgi:ribosomal protein S25